MKFNVKEEYGDKDARKLLRRVTVTKKQKEYINDLFNNYIIFSNKKGIGYCTACKKVLKGKFKHNEKRSCPKCGKEVIEKSEGMIQATETKYAMQFQNTERGIIAFVTESGRIIKKYGLDEMIETKGLKILTYPSAIYFFSAEEQHAYECYRWSGWSKNTTICIKGGLENQYIAIDRENLEDTLEKSYLRYIKGFIKKSAQYAVNDPNGLLKRMALCSKHPQAEFLYKMGFEGILNEKLWKCKNYRAVRWNATRPEKLLGITKTEIKMLQNHNIGHESLKIVQRLRQEGNPIKSYEELEQINIGLDRDALPLKYTTIRKLQNYYEKCRKCRMKLEDANSPYLWKSDYTDYLRMAEELGYNLNDTYYLMPKDLENAHDRVLEEWEEREKIKEKEEREKERQKWKNAIKEADKLSYSNDRFLIHPPESIEELEQEGRVLRHCVATYRTRVCDGRTMIFFIRKKECPQQPFYTLELSPEKKMRQCRGERNCGMTEEVKAFVDEWLAEIKKPKKKKEAA